MYQQEIQKKRSSAQEIDEQEIILTEEYLKILEEEQEKNQVYIAS